MSYEAGQTTSIDDLFKSKLRTFALANGWTDPESPAVNGRQYYSKTGSGLNCFFGFRWDTTTPANVGVYQALTYVNGSTVPGSHTNDSGQGVVTSFDNNTVTGGRCIDLDNNTNNYWFFESDDYIHVVVEKTPVNFRHFGFGQLQKFGTWTGGEYAYGHYTPTPGVSGDNNCALLDGLSSGSGLAYLPSIHAESLPSQTASGKWLVCGGAYTMNATTDRGGTGRNFAQGGFRSGPVAYPFAKWSGTPSQGLVPLTPIVVLYANGTRVHPLGMMRDVRAINMASYAGGQEITVGSDTWIVFPTVVKGTISGTTLNQGIAYKKVTI